MEASPGTGGRKRNHFLIILYPVNPYTNLIKICIPNVPVQLAGFPQLHWLYSEDLPRWWEFQAQHVYLYSGYLRVGKNSRERTRSIMLSKARTSWGRLIPGDHPVFSKARRLFELWLNFFQDSFQPFSLDPCNSLPPTGVNNPMLADPAFSAGSTYFGGQKNK